MSRAFLIVFFIVVCFFFLMTVLYWVKVHKDLSSVNSSLA